MRDTVEITVEDTVGDRVGRQSQIQVMTRSHRAVGDTVEEKWYKVGDKARSMS